jgi:hypothetical protein
LCKFKGRFDERTEIRGISVEVFESTVLPTRKHQKWKMLDIKMIGEFFATMFRGGGFIDKEARIKAIE